MTGNTINGKSYLEMLKSGAAYLSEQADKINAMNVFPVADGDTGTNMQKTIMGAISEADENDSIAEVSKRYSRGGLLSARGNSGVILSQIFAGINEVLKDYEEADASVLAKAYESGVKRSYLSVQNPTEGTILTVFREGTEYASKNINESSSVKDFFGLHVEEARRSLQRTKEIMPLLKEEDVVDSGGAGYLAIAEGMYDALLGNAHVYNGNEPQAEKINIDLFTRDSVLEFGYCTEFLLRLMSARVDPDTFEIDRIISVLEELSGESIVAYKEGDVVKVHVHTKEPGIVLSRMQEFGEFLTLKIENMSLGHSDEKLREKTREDEKKKKKSFAVVAVASGEGIESLFLQMGADKIVTGGQTINPSVEEFVKAFDECDAPDIIVLPNNKNVILAANGAAEIYEGARVHVIESRTIAEGYSALSVITPAITDIDALVKSAAGACKGVTSVEVTRAVRDATIDGVCVSEGDYMALSGGRIAAVGESAEDALTKLMSSIDADDYEILTLFVGRDVSDEKRVEITEEITEQYPSLAVTVYVGSQAVYDYLVALE